MEAVADNAQPRLPGAILAAERERQGLGAADIAQRLHMSVWQVEALEAGNYAKLPRGPFLRGFVRNYAKFLGVPADDLLARLADAAPRDPAPRIVVPSQNIRFDPLSDRMANPYVKAAGIASLVIALGFAAMYWWVFIRHAAPVAATRKPEASPALSTSPAPSPAPVVSAPQAEPRKTIATAPTPEPPKTIATAPTPEPPKAQPPKTAAEPPTPAAEPAKPTLAMALARPVASSESGSVLRFRFTGKSWVEIRDARGRVLMTGLNDPGSETEVSGKPPFKVVVGNAPEVRMFFNDREFDLEPHMREAVARVTVE